MRVSSSAWYPRARIPRMRTWPSSQHPPTSPRTPSRRVRTAPLDFEIVPLKGLPIVAVVMGLLIAAIASNKLWPLEFFHVAGGAAWTIIDLFLGLVLGPIMGKMSVPARIEFTTKLMPKMVLIMPVVVTATLAAGWQLATYLGTNITSNPLHGWVVASMIVVGVMAILALGLLEPRQRRRPVRAQEAPAEPRGDRAPDEALHLLRRRPRRDAGGDARDHDQAGIGVSGERAPLPAVHPDRDGVARAHRHRRHLPRLAHPPARAARAPHRAADRLRGTGGRQPRPCSPGSRGFAWPRFFQVGKWALLAYLFTAGLIEFAFLQNHVKGGPLGDPDPVPARLRGPGPGAHRVHRRPLRRLLRRRRRRLARPSAKLGCLAPVAQLDRASVYGTEGREFESLRARWERRWRRASCLYDGA